MRKKLSSLDHALLGLIEQRAISGYDLCKVFETTPMGHYSASPGSIYPALQRLEKRGLIKGSVDRKQSLRPRRLFELEPVGRRELVEWVCQAVTRDDIVWAKDELLLRFGFMDALVDANQICRFLEQLIEQCAAELKSLESHHRGMREQEAEGAPPPTGRLALGYGIASYRNLKRWAMRSLAEYRAHEAQHD